MMITFNKVACLIALLCIITLPVMTASAATGSRGVTSILVSIEANAEAMVEAAIDKNISLTQSLHLKIHQELLRLTKQVDKQAFDERRSRELLMTYSWMRIISIDIKQSAWIGIAIAANQLTASIIRFTRYPTLLQRDVAWMDYLARELLLLNMEDANANMQLLDARRANLVETWSRVKTTLISKDFRNKPLVLRGDDLVNRLRGHHQSRITMLIAKKMLKLVDELGRIDTPAT